MKVKDIVAGSARLVLKDALAGKIEAGTALTSEEQADADLLLKGYNLVLNEVAIDRLPLESEERVFGESVAFSSLSRPPLKITKVTTDSGHEVSYSVSYDRIDFPKADWYNIRYSFIPPKKIMTDDFDYEKSKVGERAFLYGTASEYCVMTGRYEEATNWRLKFENASSPLRKPVKKIKGRIWG